MWVVEGQYNSGEWEELTASDNRSEAKQSLREYEENEPEYPHRLVRVEI